MDAVSATWAAPAVSGRRPSIAVKRLPFFDASRQRMRNDLQDI